MGACRAGYPRGRMSRRESHLRDADYVLDLCDELLGERALREHRFAWLVGDPGRSGVRRRLPVDAYYPGHLLVVEYHERQHEERVVFFDKPEKLTVSGVGRREQRRRYDERRRTEIPAHGLRLVIVRWSDLDADARGRLRRNQAADRESVVGLLRPALRET